MTNILKTLAVALTLAATTAALSGVAFAGSDSPFYPDHFKTSGK